MHFFLRIGNPFFSGRGTLGTLSAPGHVRGPRVYTTVQVWAPAGLHGACSGRSKPGEHVVKRLQLDVFSNTAKNSKSVRGQKRNYDHKQLLMMRVGLLPSFPISIIRRYCTLLSLSCILVRCMLSSGLFSWSTVFLAFASRQFAPKIVDFSVRSVRIIFFFLLFPCERA